MKKHDRESVTGRKIFRISLFYASAIILAGCATVKDRRSTPELLTLIASTIFDYSPSQINETDPPGEDVRKMAITLMIPDGTVGGEENNFLQNRTFLLLGIKVLSRLAISNLTGMASNQNAGVVIQYRLILP
jgi:hypothetical protein